VRITERSGVTLVLKRTGEDVCSYDFYILYIQKSQYSKVNVGFFVMNRAEMVIPKMRQQVLYNIKNQRR
jgi:hypothetical protein